MTHSTPTDPAALLSTLIRCPSVTPDEGGALAALEAMLSPLGFLVERPVFEAPGTPAVENLFARRGESGPHLVFAGHTDVVPPGRAEDWREGPFSGAVRDGFVWGRGAVDMKGGIACFLAALARLAEEGALPQGRISLLVTGDEEGPAINGTVKLLDWAKARGERFDACLVGEPTNPAALGDMIKIGRRGSLSGHLHVEGAQGHAAYPHLAANPIPLLLALGQALIDPPLDAGNARFDPSNLEIVSVDTGNPSLNVIPARACLAFNVRFNDEWNEATLKAELTRRLAAAEAGLPPRAAGAPERSWRLDWKEPVSDVFLTRDDALAESLSAAVEAVTGRRPALSTSGGTSDARFIKNHCPVAEFGLVGQTMHKVDERASVADLEQLTEIYRRFVVGWFAART